MSLISIDLQTFLLDGTPKQNVAGSTMPIADTVRDSETEGKYPDQIFPGQLIMHTIVTKDVMRLMSMRRVGDDEMAIGERIS